MLGRERLDRIGKDIARRGNDEAILLKELSAADAAEILSRARKSALSGEDVTQRNADCLRDFVRRFYEEERATKHEKT